MTGGRPKSSHVIRRNVTGVSSSVRGTNVSINVPRRDADAVSGQGRIQAANASHHCGAGSTNCAAQSSIDEEKLDCCADGGTGANVIDCQTVAGAKIEERRINWDGGHPE